KSSVCHVAPPLCRPLRGCQSGAPAAPRSLGAQPASLECGLVSTLSSADRWDRTLRPSRRLTPLDGFERSRVETLDHLVQRSHPLLVPRAPAPSTHVIKALPRPEADERPGVLEVAEQKRLRPKALRPAPLGPLAPPLHEDLLEARLDHPGRVR